MYDELYRKSKEGYNFKKLMEIITHDDNIRLAYRNLKFNKGSYTSGVDKKDIRDYESLNEDDFILYIRRRLENFQPMPVRRVEIPKPNGKTRPLGIPTMADRLIQQCIKQVLEPIAEAKFHKHSYGFREMRSTNHAIFRMQHLINNANLLYCVDVDIKSFFDEVDHGKLLKQLWSMGVRDKRLIRVISKMLKCEVDGVVSHKGTPQGGILSPLFANIVLNEFDWWISNQYETKKLEGDKIWEHEKTRWKHLPKTKLKKIFIVRYADDFKIMCKDYVTAVKILEATKMWLWERLKLTVSETKTKIVNLKENYSEFLGISIKARKINEKKYGAISKIDEKRICKICESINSRLRDIIKNPTKKTVYLYNQTVNGLHNYYSRATHVIKGFKKIYFRFRAKLRNRLKQIGKYGYYRSSSQFYNDRYFSKNSYKVWCVGGEPLVPLADVNHKINKAFYSKLNRYTKEGRQCLGYQELLISDQVRTLRLESRYKDDVQLNDNRISKYSAQRGICPITKVFLTQGRWNLHHIKPKKFGGDNSYNNIVWIDKYAHYVIHATNQDIIVKYIEKMKNYCNCKIDELIKNINKYRLKAKMEKITI